MARDNFLKKTVDALAKRAGYQCSNPGCRRGTVGPSEKNLIGHELIGVAAHISAAASGGPRFNSNLTAKERGSIENAIHLCQNCAKIIDSNHGIDFSTEMLLGWKLSHEKEVREKLRNPVHRQNQKTHFGDKNILNVLERWSKSLEEGCVYRTHAEIVEFFCRHVIPFIQKQPDLQPLVITWHKDYETRLLENKYLQQKTLQETEFAFREIVQTAGETTEIIRIKMDDIEEILLGKPGKEGFSSWPLFRKAYFAVKELLEMFLDDGKLDFCARYAILGTTDKYSDDNGTVQYGKEPCILEFTFSSTIMEASRKEKAFSAPLHQDPAVVWKYFETALQFWNANEADMKKSLTFLFKTDPFQALSQKDAWQEIAQVKSRIQEKKEPLLFTAKLFKNGLRTLVNEVTLFISHDCQSAQKIVEQEKACLLEIH